MATFSQHTKPAYKSSNCPSRFLSGMVRRISIRLIRVSYQLVVVGGDDCKMKTLSESRVKAVLELFDGQNWKYFFVQTPEIFSTDLSRVIHPPHLRLPTVSRVTNFVSILFIVLDKKNMVSRSSIFDRTEQISPFCTKIATARPIGEQAESPDQSPTNRRAERVLV